MPDATTAAPQPEPLAFFPGFVWPIPRAFAAALSSSRFEQGDVLYREPGAYEPLNKASDVSGEAIQILQPPRSARGIPVEGDGDRRLSNWDSEVHVALLDLKTGRSEERTLSQGQLVTALWKGDARFLDPTGPIPELPLTARDLHSRLQEADAFRHQSAKARRVRVGVQFLMTVDLASDASNTKAAQVEDALERLGKFDRVDGSLADFGIADPERFHPTLSLSLFTLKNVDIEAAEAALRGCLYRGGSAKKSESTDATAAEEKADRFSVSRHGVLEAIGKSIDATRSESSPS